MACSDDVGDHEKWAGHFAAPRIMHVAEIRPDIADIEVQLRGTGPWDLEGSTVDRSQLDGGVQIIHVPGHTKGSICLWHAPTKVMFSGDHLGYSESYGGVSIFPRYNRGGVGEQLASVEKLLEYDFLHVLPGHGRRFSMKDATERLKMVATVKEAFA
jgi:glyoxylase-like metal-dependent hydrolase (beta-lactamase superfamily II)